MLKFDFNTYNNKYVKQDKLETYKEKNEEIKNLFFTDELSHWTRIDTYVSDEELLNIKKVSDKIKKICDVFIVIGIGGSYMGAKAVIDALTPVYSKKKPEIIFLGKNINPNEYNELLEYIKDKEVAVNVISKSGTTLEPSIAFELILNEMKKKYNQVELKERVIITTDEKTGTLRELVNQEGYQSFVVPTIVGGRYSVFTPVGLLPIAVAGIDIIKLLLGVKNAMTEQLDNAINYATIRDIMYNNDKFIESYTIYDEKLNYLAEWLKQLYAESHGKEQKGILPIANVNTRDLHSMGQYLQEGKDIIFETVIGVKNNTSLYIDKYNCDLNELNNMALEKVCEAHNNGYTPSSIIWLDKLDEENLGELMQFFMFAAIVGGKQLGINPFDQPGVQEYKRLINEGLNEKFTN